MTPTHRGFNRVSLLCLRLGSYRLYSSQGQSGYHKLYFGYYFSNVWPIPKHGFLRNFRFHIINFSLGVSKAPCCRTIICDDICR